MYIQQLNTVLGTLEPDFSYRFMSQFFFLNYMFKQH